jgi:hypothetical protein
MVVALAPRYFTIKIPNMKNIGFPTKFVTVRNMLIVTVLYMIFPIFILPKAQRTLELASGKPGYIQLDLRPGFSPDQAWEALNALGETGRQQYRFFEAFFDIIYPLIYGIFFAMMIVFLFRQVGGRLSRMTAVAWFPLVGMVADWLENIGIIRLIDAFPERADGWAKFASIAGQVKWFFSGVALLYIMVGLGAWGWAVIKQRS